MPIDPSEPFSPGWWLEQLETRLVARRTGRGWASKAKARKGRPGLDLLDSYMRGDPPLPPVMADWAEALRPYIRQSRLNIAELIVEAAQERMIPTGWTTAIDSDENGDQVAARIAAANELDLQLADVYGSMLTLGDGYTILGKDEDADEDEPPLITAEDPREVITAEDPATRRTLAALKVYADEWGEQEVAVLYLPGEVWRATRGGTARRKSRAWEWDEGTPKPWPAGFEDFVPVYRFRNRRGVGDYEPHLDILDRINDGIFGRVAIAKYQAFRQRAVKNLPEKDAQGREVDYTDVFTADPGAFWRVPKDVEFWESQPIDLGPIRLAIKDDVEQLAAVTRTPMYFISPDAASGSAEGASTQREGLVYRTRNRQRRANAAQARMMAGAFRMMGQADRADVLAIRTLWQPAERYSIGERASAASQARSGGLPTRRIWSEIWQFPPEDFPALEREEAEDLRRDAERAALLERAAQGPSAGPGRSGEPAG